jgi:dTDP-D-glucose 4,6-dehydratase
MLDRKMPLHNNGSPIRNWLHAKDTASAVIKIIESGVYNQIYNVCGNFEQSNIETFTKISKLYEKRVEDFVDFTYNREGQDVRYSLDDSKLRLLGWNPTANFDEELIDTVNFYKTRYIW